MASRLIDLLITYRLVKLISTDFKNQEAFKFGIIDEKGKVLKKASQLKTEAENITNFKIICRF